MLNGDYMTELSRIQRLQQLFELLTEDLKLLPGSPLFRFIQQETNSPASNACWVKGGNFCFHIVCDGLLAGCGKFEPGCSVSYGHLDRDRGSFHLLNTSGIIKFNPAMEKEEEKEGYYGEDDAEAIRVLMRLLLDYEAKFKISLV